MDYKASDKKQVNKSNHDYKLASKESTNKANAPRLLAEAEVAQEYTVTYHLNGGEGTVPVQAALEAGAVFAAARGTQKQSEAELHTAQEIR